MLLTYQVTIAFLFFFILLYAVYLAIIVVSTGDSFLIFVTFAVTWLIDQTKQFGTLAMIYIIVVRRFGFLKENEKEFIDFADRDVKREDAIPRLKHSLLGILEH